MKLNTHLKLDTNINGTVLELEEGYSKIKLITKDFMCADSQGLIHGGFAFCAADFAAMAAVNDPYVVLVKSETKFLAPVKLGETIIFEANITSKDRNRSTIEVTALVNENEVFKGTFYTATLKKHILSKD
jgi:acyl-coenzyme A thioesterase PaaI-like protein